MPASDYTTSSTANLTAALHMLRADTSRGLPAELKLEGGVHTIASFVFDKAILASAVRLVGVPDTVLRPSAARIARLFEVRAGAPRVELHHLILQSAPLLVSNGSLTLQDCRFEACEAIDGGALLVVAGDVAAVRTMFIGNAAQRGGAVFASGGSFASFAWCTFAQNAASESGGAIAIDGTADVTLSDGSLLVGNTAASGVGGAVHRVSAASTLRYTLPAPPGRWVESFPHSTVELLANSEELNQDYPNPCAPGLVGSDRVWTEQASAACSGRCPAGFKCPIATAQPVPCEAGTFCLEGSPVATRACGLLWNRSVFVSVSHRVVLLPVSAL